MASTSVTVQVDAERIIHTIKRHIHVNIEPLVNAVRAEGHRAENAHTGCDVCAALALLAEPETR